ncbi:hypothetical protein SBRCBS47491_003828 [Sporothrix bragantina]|uniref:Uncharacterized protein n=1 Tax=Sporothrix bragantina TaxID=671064 RepID=A0ABP0BIR9_9PEZI
MAQAVDGPPRYSEDHYTTAPMAEKTTGAGMHPDMMNTGRNNHHLGGHHNNGMQNYSNAGVDTCTNTACQDKHHNHDDHHGGMAGMGLGAAAGGAAGMAAGKHMHHNNQNGLNHNHGLHHTRGGNLGNGPEMVGSGMAGDAMAGGGMAGGAMTSGGGAVGMNPATAQTEVEKLEAEAHNNFPGTNPHPAHSALNMRGGGHGMVFPGRV